MAEMVAEVNNLTIIFMKKSIYISIIIIIFLGLYLTLSTPAKLTFKRVNKDSVDYVNGLDSSLISHSFIPYDDDKN